MKNLWVLYMKHRNRMGKATITRIEPTADGWYEWEKVTPPRGVLISVRYNYGDGSTTAIGVRYREDVVLDFMNPAGMEWCLTGIGREQLLARTQQA